MTKPAAAFHHPRRECVWCGGRFTPTPTLSPESTEHFCSPECALARHQARALDILFPGAYDKARQVAVGVRRTWSTEVAQRLQVGRDKARQTREDTSC